jgi:RNA polymerase sigma factor (sigma-70 family)
MAQAVIVRCGDYCQLITAWMAWLLHVWRGRSYGLEMPHYGVLVRRSRMSNEEKQLRAWLRVTLRRAAIRWLRAQKRYEDTMIPHDEEGMMTWCTDTYEDLEAEVRVWMVHCLRRLNPRDQQILQAVADGRTPSEIAQMLHCDVSTVRRRIYGIRQDCPL